MLDRGLGGHGAEANWCVESEFTTNGTAFPLPILLASDFLENLKSCLRGNQQTAPPREGLAPSFAGWRCQSGPRHRNHHEKEPTRCEGQMDATELACSLGSLIHVALIILFTTEQR